MDFDFEVIETNDWWLSEDADIRDDVVQAYGAKDVSPLSEPTAEEGLKFMNEGLQFMNEGLQFMNEGLQFMNEGLQFMNEGLQFMNEGLQFAITEEGESGAQNLEIQRLMQMMTQNDTLEYDVREKTSDTENAIIGKI